MKEDKKMTSKKRKSSETEEKKFHFIKETIKDKPIDKKKVLTHMGVIAAAGIIFGIAAAMAFAAIAPGLLQRSVEGQPSKVDIPQDDPEVTPTATPTPEVQMTEESAMEQYERLYQEALQISEEPRKAIVSVVGQEDAEDLLDNTLLTSGQAMGIIFVENSGSYYILTQYSAVKNVESVQVTFSNGTIVKGSVRKSDSRTNLAVVTVRKKNVDEKTKEAICVAELGNSYSLMQGKPVIAIGSPSGYNDSVYFGTITSVSNKVAVTDTEYKLLITDIPGSEKGSGFLLDTDGEVIGLIAQNYGNDSDESKTMVRALAVSQLKPLIETLSNAETIQYLGVRGQDISESVSESMQVPEGVYVESVEEDSPAMKAGLQSGDVIQELDGEEAKTMQQYSTLLQNCKEGQKIRLTLMRSKGAEGYAQMTVEAEVQSR